MRRPRPKPPRVYAIADPECLGVPLGEGVEVMAAAGLRWIQLRMKGRSDRELLALAQETGSIGATHDIELWLNDRPDLFALLEGERLAGVHLGQDDLPAEAARRVLGERSWIGVSTHDEVELEAAADDPEVDLIAIGPVFPTGSKPDARTPVGLELVRRARSVTDKPVVAVGGIGVANLASVLEAGADSVAVLSAVCQGEVGENASRLLAAAAKADVAA